MKNILILSFFLSLFLGCSKEPQVAQVLFDSLPKTHLVSSDFKNIPHWEKENYDEALDNFTNSCVSDKTQNIYPGLCEKAHNAKDSKKFIESEFIPYEINSESGKGKGKGKGLLTGYYEPELNGSLVKTKRYQYPIYTTPRDLITVDLSSIYPELKNLRLRGKVKGNRLVPYHERSRSASEHIPADVICYTDSKIDLFFLEVQGSGRVKLESGKTIFIAYDNQNGHKYSSIGKYLVSIGGLSIEEVSLQTIRAWLDANPSRIDEILNYNKSVVYFKQDDSPASGSLGLCLTASRSIAVDRRYIPLGSMLYLNAKIKDENVGKIVLAQDTGGAIKGAVRADMFLGFGQDARNTAGELKSPLKLWILLPKNIR
ncbi:MAG: membrane-bound lytic murein transglycosylase A [Sulfurimonas sp.]|jgi:membrane-bound lytic murein transglycosylase A|uniref:murein transglycosylase A n=1 Tax=Sulfurimonas sp. TaxID=2022749 RepID=UPI0039E36AC1